MEKYIKGFQLLYLINLIIYSPIGYYRFHIYFLPLLTLCSIALILLHGYQFFKTKHKKFDYILYIILIYCVLGTYFAIPFTAVIALMVFPVLLYRIIQSKQWFTSLQFYGAIFFLHFILWVWSRF